jgi:hypothetical protein
MNKLQNKIKALAVMLMAVLVVFETQAGGTYTIQSLLNGGQVSSLVVSNGVGVTNLNYIALNQLQGLYQIGTNSLGTGFNAPIATNSVGAGTSLMYTNATPVSWYGITYPGTFVALTNNTAGTATNDVSYTVITTNNQFNFFQDANLPEDYFQTFGSSGQPGAASDTNSIGLLQVVSQPFSLYGQAAGGGSNIVNLILEPIAHIRGVNPGSTPGSSYIPGFTPGLSPTDAAFTGGYNYTVTYTNQISTASVPTVYQVPLPRWKFQGASGLRLRAIYAGSSTNAVCIQSVTLQTWTP